MARRLEGAGQMDEQDAAMQGQPRRSFRLAEMSAGMALMTWFLIALGLAVPIVILILAPQVWMALLLAVILWGTFAFVWVFYRPGRFDIYDGGLQSAFPVRSLRVPAGESTDVAEISKSELGLVIRTCGAGGLWGGFGRFWSKSMGRMVIYTSGGDDLVCIRRGKKKPPLVISPDNGKEFIAELQRICGRNQVS